jgi:hypothetical protein
MFADGFTIAYRIDVACDYTRGTTLNINSLGEHPVAEQAGGTAGRDNVRQHKPDALFGQRHRHPDVQRVG